MGLGSGRPLLARGLMVREHARAAAVIGESIGIPPHSVTVAPWSRH